jgi:esterase
VGHSFGGKVVLAYAKSKPPGLQQVWVLDSEPWRLERLDPEAQVPRVLSAIEQVPMPVSRRRVVQDLFVERGFSSSVAGWMTTNLRRGEDGYVWTFDLAGVRAMLRDYVSRDYSNVHVSRSVRIHHVRGGRSERWTAEACRRLGDLASQQRHWRLHELKDAGHWVHVDASEALLDLLELELPTN